MQGHAHFLIAPSPQTDWRTLLFCVFLPSPSDKVLRTDYSLQVILVI